MAPAEEPERVPGARWASLRQALGKKILFHMGIGESVQLASHMELATHSNGFALVFAEGDAGDSDAPQLACGIFQNMLLRRTDESGQSRLFTFDKSAGKSACHSNVFEKESFCRLVECELDKQHLVLEVFVSVLPWEGALVRWGLCRALTFCLGSQFNGRYMWRHWVFWQKFCVTMGFSEQHVRAPARASAANRKTTRAANDARS